MDSENEIWVSNNPKYKGNSKNIKIKENTDVLELLRNIIDLDFKNNNFFEIRGVYIDDITIDYFKPIIINENKLDWNLINEFDELCIFNKCMYTINTKLEYNTIINNIVHNILNSKILHLNYEEINTHSNILLKMTDSKFLIKINSVKLF